MRVRRARARRRRSARAPCGNGTPARGGSRGSPRTRGRARRRSLEPVGEPFVELGAQLLRGGGRRRRGRGCGLKRKAASPTKLGARRADEILPVAARAAPGTPASVAESSTTAPRWKSSPSTAPRSSASVLAVEAVETRAEQCAQARRQRDARTVLARTMRRAPRRRAGSRRMPRRAAPSRRLRRTRLSSSRSTSARRAAQAAPSAASPGGCRAAPAARGRAAGAAPPTLAGRVASRSSRAGSAQWMSSTSTISGCPAAARRGTARRPARSLAVAAPSPSPSSCAIRARRRLAVLALREHRVELRTRLAPRVLVTDPASSRTISATAQYVIPSP